MSVQKRGDMERDEYSVPTYEFFAFEGCELIMGSGGSIGPAPGSDDEL